MLPIAFELDATSLNEAIEKFADGVKRAVEETIQEIQQLRREAASSIVIPDVKSASGLLGGPGAPGGPGGPGGPPPGGGVHRPQPTAVVGAPRRRLHACGGTSPAFSRPPAPR